MLGNTLNLVSYTHHVFSQSSCSAVVEIFDYPATAKVLDIELAATIDADKHFVQATYYLIIKLANMQVEIWHCTTS